MIDDDEGSGGAVGEGAASILYDYYKYLTSLCIFSLGGVLALADRIPEAGRGRELVVGALVVISLAALLAFTGVGEFARSRSEGTAARQSVLRYSGKAPVLLSIGLGMFIYLFTKSIFR